MGFGVTFRAERRGLYFVALAVLALSIHSDAADFSYQTDRILSINSTNSHMGDHCSRINDHSNLTADFCGYPTLPWNRPGSRIYRLTLQSGVTQAYIGLLLLHLNFQKNLIGVVHWGNPPSPGLLISFDSGVHWTVPPWVYGYIIAHILDFDNWQTVRNIKIFFVYKVDFVYNAQLFLDTGPKV